MLLRNFSQGSHRSKLVRSLIGNGDRIEECRQRAQSRLCHLPVFLLCLSILILGSLAWM